MNKWYRPIGFMLLAAVAGELCGCTSTGNWLSSKTFRKNQDEALAKKKPGSSKSKDKSSKELADAKSDDSRNSAADSKKKAKSADSSQTKLAAASDEAPKRPKGRAERSPVDSAADAIASTRTTKAKKTPDPTSEDDLDSFLAKIETPKVAKKSVATKPADDDFDPLSDAVAQTRKAVAETRAQVAKTAAAVENDFADWADDGGSKHSKVVTPVNASTAADAFDDEPEAANTAKSNQKPVASKADTTEDAPELSLSSLKKSAIRKVTTAGLTALCPNAEGELAAVLQGIDPTNSESLKQGLTQIGQMGAKGAAASPLLQKMLKHEDAFVRTHSALAMAQLKLTSPESIKVVTDALKSKDANLRSFGSAVLSEMGPQSNQVLTSLSECLNDKDGQTRLRAAEVLIRHDGFAYPALQCLLNSLKDKSENVRWLAAYSLAELAPESAEAVQALMKATQDPSSKVRVGAVYALGEIGPFANRATDDLRAQLKSTSDDELKAAINSTLPKIAK